MKLYVGITDRDWFRFLRKQSAEEMNFWRPRSTSVFAAIQPGELFLFKTKFPENRIVGGAFFVRHTTLPLDMAWATFGVMNGSPSQSDLWLKIRSIRGDSERNPIIGCTVLTQPFYLQDRNFLPPPEDWSSNIVTGKSYDVTSGEGQRLYVRAMAAIPTASHSHSGFETAAAEVAARYGSDRLVAPRLGQGGFRVSVMDEYQRRCSITGERTLPVLEACHIRPYTENGPHKVSNGLFLRSDLHTLFDRGYVTLSNDLRLEVSRRIRDEFSNGKEYYALHGQGLRFVPNSELNRPSKEFLEWHQSNRYLGS